MTDKKCVKRRKFSHEVLGLTGISALFALILFLILTGIAAATAETYCFDNDVVMTEFDWIEVDRWIFGLGAAISVGSFSLLFLALLGDRLAYLREITEGIDALRMGQEDHAIELVGNNELTELAAAINYMSAAQQQLRRKEQALAQEKEQLIRTLSHDIRTPLTAVLAYSEYLATEEELSAGERKTHLQMIRRKAEQIRELTDILLDGGKRNPERFEDARLLMEQLAQEFEAELEDRFTVRLSFDRCPAFAGSFDVQELRRIFDNLSSNVRKYADPEQPVCLSIRADSSGLVVQQTNTVRRSAEWEDGYGLGISSIRRIAQHYGGKVSVRQDDKIFEITVILSNL